jgi:hypothetical protein
MERKVDNINQVDIYRKLSQMGGNHWLLCIIMSLEMVQRCGGNTYEQGESRRGEER